MDLASLRRAIEELRPELVGRGTARSYREALEQVAPQLKEVAEELGCTVESVFEDGFELLRLRCGDTVLQIDILPDETGTGYEVYAVPLRRPAFLSA